MQRDIKLINGNLLTRYIDLLSAEKMELGDGPMERGGGGGGGIFYQQEFFWLSNCLYEFCLGHSMNISLGLIGLPLPSPISFLLVRP